MDNFWEAAEDLFFGGQPTAEDLKELAGKGVKTVINLRLPQEESELPPDQEREAAEALGMRYVNLPVPVGEITNELAEKMHETIRASKSDGPVFVH